MGLHKWSHFSPDYGRKVLNFGLKEACSGREASLRLCPSLQAFMPNEAVAVA